MKRALSYYCHTCHRTIEEKEVRTHEELRHDIDSTPQDFYEGLESDSEGSTQGTQVRP